MKCLQVVAPGLSRQPYKLEASAMSELVVDHGAIIPRSGCHCHSTAAPRFGRPAIATIPVSDLLVRATGFTNELSQMA